MNIVNSRLIFLHNNTRNCRVIVKVSGQTLYHSLGCAMSLSCTSQTFVYGNTKHEQWNVLGVLSIALDEYGRMCLSSQFGGKVLDHKFNIKHWTRNTRIKRLKNTTRITVSFHTAMKHQAYLQIFESVVYATMTKCFHLYEMNGNYFQGTYV